MSNKKIISISLNSIITTIHVKDSPLNLAHSAKLNTTVLPSFRDFNAVANNKLLNIASSLSTPSELSNESTPDFSINSYNLSLKTTTPLLNPMFNPASFMGIGMQMALKTSLEISDIRNPLYFSLLNPFSGVSNSIINQMEFDTKSDKVKATSKKITKNGFEGINLNISDGKGNTKKIEAAKSLKEGKGYKKVTQDGIEEETELQISEKGIVITETITENGHACFQKQMISDEVIIGLIEAFEEATSKDEKALIFDQITAHAVTLKKQISYGADQLHKDIKVSTIEAWQCVPLKNTAEEIIKDITQTVLWIQEKVTDDKDIKENQELQQKAKEAVATLEEIVVDLNIQLEEIKKIELKQAESQTNIYSKDKLDKKTSSKKQEKVLNQIMNKIVQTFSEQQNRNEIEQAKKEKKAQEAITKAINKKLDQQEILIKRLIKKMETKVEELKEQNMLAIAQKIEALIEQLNNQIDNNQNLAEAA